MEKQNETNSKTQRPSYDARFKQSSESISYGKHSINAGKRVEPAQETHAARATTVSEQVADAVGEGGTIAGKHTARHAAYVVEGATATSKYTGRDADVAESAANATGYGVSNARHGVSHTVRAADADKPVSEHAARVVGNVADVANGADYVANTARRSSYARQSANEVSSFKYKQTSQFVSRTQATPQTDTGSGRTERFAPQQQVSQRQSSADQEQNQSTSAQDQAQNQSVRGHHRVSHQTSDQPVSAQQPSWQYVAPQQQVPQHSQDQFQNDFVSQVPQKPAMPLSQEQEQEQGSASQPVQNQIKRPAGKHSVKRTKVSIAQTFLEFLGVIAAAVVLAFLILVFVAQPYTIPSGSMEETIQVNDRVFSEKISYYFDSPKPGDIVTFKDVTDENRTLIKRVIAVGGQTVDIRNGSIYVDGVKKQEDYTNGKPTYNPKTGITYPYTVPADHIWVMGDNRTNSQDSRWFGAVPVANVTGHAFLRFWPLNSIGLLQ